MLTYRNYLDDFNNHRQELSQQLEKFEVPNDIEIELNLRQSIEELTKPSNITIQQHSIPFIINIHVTLLFGKYITVISI